MSANPKLVDGKTSDFRLLINGRLIAGASTLDVINGVKERPGQIQKGPILFPRKIG